MTNRKGADFERMVADYIKDETGMDVDRRVKCGTNDRGDLSGLTVCGMRCVVEVKNRKRFDLPGWLGEAESERRNDGAEIGVVIAKRPGFGGASMGGQYVLMDLDTLIRIIREGSR